jgi:hypothetical protein
MGKGFFGIAGYININGLNFKGSWNANTNVPFLQSSVGTNGDYYIVSVAGTTNLNGTTDWQIGDWALFEGATNMWQKVDNHDVQAYTFIQDDGTSLPQQSILDFQGDGVTASNGVGKTIVDIPIQPAYATIENQGTPLPQQTTLNFSTGFNAVDTGSTTRVSVITQPAYATIQEEGVALTQQPILDFQGAGVTAGNGTGKTIVTIPIQPAYKIVQAEGISLPQRTTLNFTGGLTAVDSGGVTIVNITSPTNYGLYAQYQNSTPITNTTTESSVIGAGFGTLSVPANGFKVGDSFRCDFGGLMSSKNNETIRIRIKSGSVVLADSGIQSLPNITNEVWQVSINFTIRQVGGVGVASIVTLGVFSVIKTSNASQQGFAFNSVNNTTFDTTINNTLNVTAQWGSASTQDNIYSDIFVLNKIY